MVGYAGTGWHGPINYELFLPKKWFSEEYAVRRKRCGIPGHVGHRTKIEIAIELPRSIAAGGKFEGRWVGADSWFGNCAEFVDSISEWLHCFVDVHHDARLFAALPAVSTPEWVGRGRKPRRPRADQKPAKASSIVEKSDVPWQEARQRHRLQGADRRAGQAAMGLGGNGQVAGKAGLAVREKNEGRRHQVRDQQCPRGHPTGEIQGTVARALVDRAVLRGMQVQSWAWSF